MGVLQAQSPARLSRQDFADRVARGDALADRGEYLLAVQNYTIAYLSRVAEVRGQSFVRDVPPTVFTRNDLKTEMLRMMAEEFTPGELHLMAASYKVLGLVPPEIDCNSLITKLYTEEIAGFYDPSDQRMVLVLNEGESKDPGWLGRMLGAKMTFDKEEQKSTLAHELTHALQDQLYGLDAMEERIKHDDDMLLAFSSLVEGDATLLMMVEAEPDTTVADMDPEAMRATFNILSWMLPLAGGETYRKAPAIFRESLIFPYMRGMLFALNAAKQGGWDGVHRCYQSPPTSTEQILHPEKYFSASKRDDAQVVHIADEVKSSVGPGWKQLGGNTLGELQMSILLKGVSGGTRAAEGWDGDRYEVYENDDGQLAVVLVTIWDSAQDAAEFEQAQALYFSRILTSQANVPASEIQSNSAHPEADGSKELSAENLDKGKDTQETNGVNRVERKTCFAPNATAKSLVSGNTVSVVVGFDEQQTPAILDASSKSQFTPKAFPSN